jgi:hypothetical protein
MSKYKAIQTEIKDADLLAKVLQQVGAARGFEVENHLGDPQHLIGFLGKQRPETAEFIVRRNYLAGASNDLGLARQEDGTWKWIVSEYDQRQPRTMGIFEQVNYDYAVTSVTQLAERQGYTVTPVKDTTGKVVELKLAQY